jgi:hypothetical protein
MGALFSYANDADSKSVSDRLAVLMYDVIENATFAQHNAYIKCMYKDWNSMVIKFSYDNPTDRMLSDIFPRRGLFYHRTCHVYMCICS